MTGIDEAAALVALLRVSQRSWAEVAADVAFAGSAVEIWERADDGTLLPDPDRSSALARAQRDVETWRAAGLRMVTVLDACYPQRLLDIHEVPPFLFVEGTLLPDDSGMSVVGSRAASEHGLKIARAAAGILVERGLSVVSGLATGIDTAAHQAALAMSGRTVAFIGTGITGFYPAANKALQARIAAEGLVASQFWPAAPPTKQTFPVRNATMSGYGLASIVVEAGENSGARIQARLAVEHGRPVVLTDTVAQSTTWGARLATRPGVHVVDSIDSLERTVDTIVAERDSTAQALQGLAAAISA
ncbi:MAG: DNA-protecting protein DprA [Micrococcales bacterium]|nr:DNA-protecting protein DprA [Micrococcales bacterium]